MDQDSKRKKSAQRQKKHRDKVAADPSLHSLSLQKRRERYERNKKLNLKNSTRSAFLTTFESAKNNNKLKTGYYFILNNALNMTKDEVCDRFDRSRKWIPKYFATRQRRILTLVLGLRFLNK